MTCWPPCSSQWCECNEITGKCEPKRAQVNAVRLKTLNDRYLTAVNVNDDGGGLTANFGSPSQSATFLLVSRPTESPLTMPPPINSPYQIASGSPISLVVCNTSWGASTNLMRVDYITFIIPIPPHRHGLFDGFFGFFRHHDPLEGYYFGGPKTLVWVSGPRASGGASTSDTDPLEWIFSIEKAGGGAINSGDQVSLRIDGGSHGSFYFRTTSTEDQAPIGGDGTAPFQSDTVFVVEFHEARVGLGVRPPEEKIVCQICGPVTGKVTDADTGLGIRDATVETQGVLDGHIFGATTKPDGTFELVDQTPGFSGSCVPPGNVTLKAYANRYQRKTTDPIPDPTASADGAIVPIKLVSTKVSGRVIDDNGNAIIFSYVHLTSSDGKTFLSDGPTKFGPVMADAIGRFVFERVPHVNAGLWTDGLPEYMKITVLPGENPGENYFEIKVATGGCVEVVGTVTDAFTNLPICGVKVTVFGSSNSAMTDSQGRYKIPCMSPKGTNLLAVVKPGYKYNFLVVQNFPPSSGTGTVTQDIKLEPTSITSLFNTGVDACGIPLPDGTVGDPHYKLVSIPGGTTGIRVRTSAGGYPIPPYEGDNPISAWIGPNNDGLLTGPIGEYRYRTTFDLTGFDPSTAVITGQWSSDNEGLSISLNGRNTGIPATLFEQFRFGFVQFEIKVGFQPGLNTLDFIVNNGGGSTALRVEMTSKATVATGP